MSGPARTTLLIAVVAAAILTAGVLLLLRPAWADRQAARQELAAAQQIEAGAASQLLDAQRAREDAPGNRRMLAALGKVVPRSAESARLLDRLDAAARDSGVRFESLVLDPATPAAAPTPSETGKSDRGTAKDPAPGTAPGQAPVAGSPPAGVQKLPVTVTMTGRYPELYAVLRRLHGRPGARPRGRLLGVTSVHLARPEAGGGGGGPTPGRLEAEITAVAYLRPPSAGGPAPATGADPSASTATPSPAPTTSTAAAPGGQG